MFYKPHQVPNTDGQILPHFSPPPRRLSENVRPKLDTPIDILHFARPLITPFLFFFSTQDVVGCLDNFGAFLNIFWVRWNPQTATYKLLRTLR